MFLAPVHSLALFAQGAVVSSVTYFCPYHTALATVPGPHTQVLITLHYACVCVLQVGNWVGHQRWVLVELTSGGFDWGPALGGQGVVHRHSMPSVQDHFSALHALKQSEFQARDGAVGVVQLLSTLKLCPLGSPLPILTYHPLTHPPIHPSIHQWVLLAELLAFL